MAKRTRLLGARTVLALLAVLSLPGDAFAITWGTPKQLGSGPIDSIDQGSVVSPASGVVVAAYESSGSTYVRRSADAGVTWGTSRRVTYGYNGMLAAWQGRVHLVYTIQVAPGTAPWCPGVESCWVIAYRRSTDAGTTWSAQRILGLADNGPSHEMPVPSVAAGTDGRVALAWTRQPRYDGVNDGFSKCDVKDSTGLITPLGRVLVRVSTNRGDTFGTPSLAGCTENHLQGNGTSGFEAFPVIAYGRNNAPLLHIAYARQFRTIHWSRSLNGGAWSAPATVTTKGVNNYGEGPRIAANPYSQRVVIGYVTGTLNSSYVLTESWPQYRQASGTVLSTPRALSSPSLTRAGTPNLSYAGGKFHALFARRNSDATWQGESLFHRASPDAVTWSASSRVLQDTHGVGPGSTAATSGKIFVTYDRSGFDASYNYFSRSYVRRGV